MSAGNEFIDFKLKRGDYEVDVDTGGKTKGSGDFDNAGKNTEGDFNKKYENENNNKYKGDNSKSNKYKTDETFKNVDSDVKFNNDGKVQILGEKTGKDGTKYYRVKYFDENGALKTDLVEAATGRSAAMGGYVDIKNVTTDDISYTYKASDINTFSHKYTTINGELRNDCETLLRNKGYSEKEIKNIISSVESNPNMVDVNGTINVNKVQDAINSIDIKEFKYQTNYKGINIASGTEEGLTNIKNYIDKVERNSSDTFRSTYTLQKIKDNNATITDMCFSREAFYSSTEKIVYLGSKTLSSGDVGTFYHEFGHKLDDYNFKYQQGLGIYNDAKSSISQTDLNKGYYKFKEDYKKVSSNMYDVIYNNKQYQDYVTEQTNIKYYQKYNVYDQNVYNEVRNGVIHDLHDSMMRDSGFSAVSDIFDALTEGKLADRNPGFYGHGSSYYTRDSISVSTETIANFSDLYNNSKTDLLDNYLPRRFREKLTSGYEKMIDYDNVATDLDIFKEAHELKYGSHSFEKSLLSYLYDGNSGHITREGGARNYIETVNKTDLMKYITSQDNVGSLLDYSKSITDTKYGEGNFSKNLQKYLETKNSSYLTRDNFVRNYIELLSDDQIRVWLKQDSITTKYFKKPGNLSSTNTSTNTVKGNNMFRKTTDKDLSNSSVDLSNNKTNSSNTSTSSLLYPNTKSTSDTITVIKKEDPKTKLKTTIDNSNSKSVTNTDLSSTPVDLSNNKINSSNTSTSSLLYPNTKSTSDTITVIKKEEPKKAVKIVDTTLKMDDYKKDLNKALSDVSDELYNEIIKKDLDLPYSSTKVTQLIYGLEDDFNDAFSKVDNNSKVSLVSSDSSKINKVKSKFIDTLNEISMENGGSRITPNVEEKINQIFKTFDFKNQKLIQTYIE